MLKKLIILIFTFKKGIEKPIQQQNKIVEQLPIINESLDKLSIDDKQIVNNQVVNQSKFILNEHNLIVIGESNYTKKELFVIKTTSKINNKEFVPWLNVDLKERFSCLGEFTDKDGFLMLSDKQKKHFAKWLRISQLIENPTIIKSIDCYSIKQTIVSIKLILLIISFYLIKKIIFLLPRLPIVHLLQV